MRGSVKVEITPMFKQYFEIKSKYPDALLFFRLGDFYEMFFEDAETVAPLLGLVLTKREAGKDLVAPMCGIPADKSNFYIQKLVDMGFKVAICEQVEDPSTAKGLVKREVVKIYTPGLTVDLEIPEKTKTYLASLYLEKKAGLAFLEISCGEFLFTEISKEEAISEILKKEPRELLVSEDLKDAEFIKILRGAIPNLHVAFLNKKSFTEKNIDFKEFTDLQKFKEGLRAVSGILEYVRSYQPYILDKLESPKFYYPEDYLYITDSAKRNLELIRNLWEGSEKYSLFWVLDKTSTPMGARLLKDWILYPLRDITKIQERQQAVKFLIEKKEFRTKLKELLKKISDLERLSTKVSLKLINPKEMALLRDSLKIVSEVKSVMKECFEILPNLLRTIANDLEDFSKLYQKLSEWLVENPPTTLKEGGIIKRGVNSFFDELLDIKEHAMEYLLELERKEREKTGIPTLKIGYNKVFGYFFEVSKGYLKFVPSYFERKQTLTNVERFVTPELKQLEEKILSADEKLKNLEYELFLQLREEVSTYKDLLKKSAQSLAVLDVLISLAEVALENDYTCPEIVEDEILIIEDGRHPVVEKIQGKENFIPNSINLNKQDTVLLIITGPNMGGKSTYLRQNALIVIMAQMGSFVPASYAKIGIFDRIFARIGAGDELTRGKSTFMVEMSECAYILKNSTPKSLVILDEVGRGTSTYDGMSLAWAIAENLYHKKIFTLLATHYFELTELGKIYKGIKNYHVSVKEWKDTIVFMYKVLPGAASRSHGIEVAKLAGIPKEVIDRAKEILSKLENKTLKDSKEIKLDSQKKIAQLSIFDNKHPVLEKIRSLEIEKITPIEALNFLWEIKKEI